MSITPAQYSRLHSARSKRARERYVVDRRQCSRCTIYEDWHNPVIDTVCLYCRLSHNRVDIQTAIENGSLRELCERLWSNREPMPQWAVEEYEERYESGE